MSRFFMVQCVYIGVGSPQAVARPLVLLTYPRVILMHIAIFRQIGVARSRCQLKGV